MTREPYVAVVGPSAGTPAELALGEAVGRGLAEAGAVLVCGGMGEARNAIVVRTADVVIAVHGEFGTLSEIALALKMGKPVVGLGTWELSKAGETVEAVVRAKTAEDAVAKALSLVPRDLL